MAGRGKGTEGEGDEKIIETRTKTVRKGEREGARKGGKGRDRGRGKGKRIQAEKQEGCESWS